MRIPDLTQSGAAVLPCTQVSFARAKGTIYRTWTLRLCHDVGPKGEPGILPQLLRFLRTPILQARAGGIALKGLKLEPGFTGVFTIRTQVHEVPVVACDDIEGVLDTVQVDASENVCKITYVLKLKAPPSAAEGFVELDGSLAEVQVRFDEGQRQPDLFTREDDLPEPMPSLLDAANEPEEEEEELPEEPTARKPRRRKAAPVAEA